ncbi:YadA-like family protein [Acinetobacter bereziniae]|uniref:YadA-like family protein n=1 Tax=Acinetobacter bereziniae TaxID=106648 RepID=UPI0021D096FE|nr:YadA-like family protein [Acinetobacter bereziniae]MCU4313555.1 YadA-like family protein [Acinetobacter bereziniae]
MNKTYKVVWNESLGTWCAISETSKVRGKRSTGKAIVAGVMIIASTMSAVTFAADNYVSVNDGGVQSGNYNNDGAIASGSVVIGPDSSSVGSSGVAIGNNADVSGLQGVAIGQNAQAGYQSMALGHDAVATAFNSMALGGSSIAYTDGTALGQGTYANKLATAMGNGSLAVGRESTAYGYSALAGTDSFSQPSAGTDPDTIGKAYATAMGSRAKASAQGSTALGASSVAEVESGVALGSSSVANTAAGVAGYIPTGANQAQSSAINATQSTLGAVSIGSTGNTRQITNVAAGTVDTDAVNVAQLKAVQAATETHYVSVNDGGVQSGNYNNDGASGKNSLAVGIGAKAAGENTIAIGNVSTDAAHSIAIGNNNVLSATAGASTVIGSNNNVTGNEAVALGSNNTVKDFSGVAVGSYNQAQGYRSIAIGAENRTNGQWSSAFGVWNTADGERSTVLGANNTIQGRRTLGVGVANEISSTSEYSSAIGAFNKITDNTKSLTAGNSNVVTGGEKNSVLGNENILNNAKNTTVLGNKNTVAQDNTQVLGNNVTTSQANSVVLGTDSTDRAATTVDKVTINGEDYVVAGAGSIANGIVSVGKFGAERQIINVAAGEVSASSTDAINGSQLYSTNQAVEKLSAGQTHYVSINDGGTQSGNYNNDGAKGVNSLAIGVGATIASGGGDSIAIGSGAQAAAGRAVVIGLNAGVGNINDGDANVLIGMNAGANNDGRWNTAVGSNSGYNTKGERNTALGDYSGRDVTGSGNIGLGGSAGNSVTGETNLAVGASAGGTVMGSHNTALGRTSGIDVVGDSNTASGLDSGSVVRGSANSAYGQGSGRNVTGDRNTAIGVSSGSNISGNYNAALAYGAGNNSIGNLNTALGFAAGQDVKGDANSAVGDSAGQRVTGNYNTAQGRTAGQDVFGIENTAVGASSGSNVGTSARPSSYNSAFGINAGRNVQGDSNLALGDTAGNNVTGSRNVAVGRAAGQDLTDVNDATSLGSGSKAAMTNSVALGANSQAIRDMGSEIAYIPVGTTIAGANANGGEVSIGSIGNERRLTNVAAASQDTDAVNLSQLKAAQAAATTHYVSVNDGGNQKGNYNNDGATGQDAVAVGTNTTATGNFATAIGNGSSAKGQFSTALGAQNNLNGASSLAIGLGNTIDGMASYAIGSGNNISANGSAAIGRANTVAQENTSVLGNLVTTTQANSVVLGNESTDRAATSESKVSINGQDYAFAGVGSASNGVVSVGKVGAERQIINVAAGKVSSDSTDAVNGSQLYATNQAITEVGKSAAAAKTEVVEGDNIVVTETQGKNGQSVYNVATAKEVSFNKTTVGTVITDSATGKITGLTAGEVSATSTDAINGSQLYATNKAIADSKTHYVSVNDDGVQADNYNNDGATGKNALAVGVGSKAAGENAVVIGYNNNVAQDKTVALGSSITTTQANSVVLGNESIDRAATAESKVTILGQDYAFAGVGSAANGVVSVGKVGGERQIINVAAGQLSATSTDAVNGSQLYATNQAISSLQGQVAGTKSTVTEGKNTTITKTTHADGSTDYQVATKDDVSFDSVTVGNIKADAQSNKISGLADGEVSATSNEAVNGSQLHGTAESVANVLGGNAKINADGTVSTSNIGNTGKDNVHDAIASLQGQVAGSKTSVSAGKNTVVNSSTNADGSNNYQVALADNINLNSVTANQVTANQVKADQVIANQVMANQVNVGKVTIDGTSNKVSGLANGTISKDSTDAINGSQLHQTNSNVAQYLGGGSTLNQDGSIGAPTYNVAGGTYHNVGDALGAVDTRVSNLEQAFYNTNKNVDDLRNDTYAGIAGAMAVGNLPQPTEAGMSMMSAGVSGYRGETAVAVGISAISDSNKIIWKMGASADSRSNIGGAVSVGYQWK